MAACEMCGNDHDRIFEATAAGVTRTFDRVECGTHVIAPMCGGGRS